MKNLKCDMCDHIAQGETFEGWMQALMPHYMHAHADFMKKQSERSAQEQKVELGKWMADNKKRFEEA